MLSCPTCRREATLILHSLSLHSEQSPASPCNVLRSSLWNYHGPEHREIQSRFAGSRDLWQLCLFARSCSKIVPKTVGEEPLQS